MTYDHSDRRAGKQAAVKLTRTERRQFEKLAARIDRVTQADALRPLVSVTIDSDKCREIEAQLLELAEVLG
jgi:hypothetical protein